MNFDSYSAGIRETGEHLKAIGNSLRTIIGRCSQIRKNAKVPSGVAEAILASMYPDLKEVLNELESLFTQKVAEPTGRKVRAGLPPEEEKEEEQETDCPF